MNRIVKKFLFESPSFWFFVLASIICAGITIWAQYRIIRTVDVYEKQLADLNDSTINNMVNTPLIQIDSIKNVLNSKDGSKNKEAQILKYCIQEIDSYVQKEISMNHKNCTLYVAEVKKILDNQYMRVRQEYEALQTWCAILTIVFLVFSFYSLYKADDMVRQGRQGLREIEYIKKEGRSNIEKIQKEANESVATFKQTIGLELVEMKDKMSGVGKKIDEISSKADLEIKRISEDVEKKVLFTEQKYDQRIQEIISEAEDRITQNDTEIEMLRAQMSSLRDEFELYKTLNPLS